MDGAMNKLKTFRFVGDLTINDQSGSLLAEVKITEPLKKPSGVGSFFKKAKLPSPFYINQFTTNIKQNGELVSCGTGNYTSHVQIDGEVYWEFTDPIIPWKVEDDFSTILPSSVQRLEISKLLKEEKYEEADTWIQEMESEQKKDAKLRKKGV